jgi:hypothetical protein
MTDATHDTDIISVGDPLPVIAAVVAAGHLRVRVTWAGGGTDVVDLAPAAARWRMLRPLKDDPALFAAVRVGYMGSSIEWRDDIDVGAPLLERLARCQRVMTTDDFRAWMRRHNLTLDAAAPVLGVSRRLIADMSTGNRPMDLTMTLACEGYDARASAGT